MLRRLLVLRGKKLQQWEQRSVACGVADDGTFGQLPREHRRKFRDQIGVDDKEKILLRLDLLKAEKELLWHGTLSAKEMFEFTALWYKEFYGNRQIATAEQLSAYINLAEKRNLAWTK